jgi:hypothetical protein
MTETIKQTFEALEWHDASLLALTIDRQTPGERDEIVILIEWTDGRKQKIRFAKCYALDAQMNFGVIGPESIREACCLTDSQKLTDLKRRWAAIGADLGGLQCFEIITNSTASTVRIFALNFDIFDL